MNILEAGNSSFVELNRDTELLDLGIQDPEGFDRRWQ